MGAKTATFAVGVPVVQESGGDAPCEHCCFCRAVTDTWTNLDDRSPGEQVACCTRCARNATPAAVPLKEFWCEREAIAMGPTPGNRDEYTRERARFAEFVEAQLNASYWEGTHRGHTMQNRDGTWRYTSDNTPVADDPHRACGHCGGAPTPEGHDACLGTVAGVMNACCGHGVVDEAYVQLGVDRFTRGQDALDWLRERGHAPGDPIT